MTIIIGDGQRPDLGMQFFHLLLVDLGGFPASSLKHARGTFKKGFLPFVDHRRMNPEPACQFGNRLFSLQRLKRHLRLEFRRMLLPFRHL